MSVKLKPGTADRATGIAITGTDDAVTVDEQQLNIMGFAALDHVGDVPDVAGEAPGIGFEDISMHELIASRVRSRKDGEALASLIIDGTDNGEHVDHSDSGTSHSAVHKLYGHGFGHCHIKPD